MDRQSSTVLVIDVDAAMDSNDLESFLYMIDTQKPWGSTGEGTSRLTTVTDGETVHTMNWATLPINTPPGSVPKGTFLGGEQEDSPILSIKGDLLAPDLDPYPQPDPILFSDPSGPGRGHRSRPRKSLLDEDGVEQSLIHPPPEIQSITGEAVSRGVMFPALYGSPALRGEGLYWSATVDTRWQGTFHYDMQIELSRLAGLTECGRKVWESCILPCRSRIRVVRTRVENGFEWESAPRRPRHRGRRHRSRHCVRHFYTTGD